MHNKNYTSKNLKYTKDEVGFDVVLGWPIMHIGSLVSGCVDPYLIWGRLRWPTSLAFVGQANYQWVDPDRFVIFLFLYYLFLIFQKIYTTKKIQIWPCVASSTGGKIIAIVPLTPVHPTNFFLT